MFIHFDVIHERDGQTDGQTLHDSKDRASHRAVIEMVRNRAEGMRSRSIQEYWSRGDGGHVLIRTMHLVLLRAAPMPNPPATTTYNRH